MVPAFPCARSVVLSCAPVGQDDTSNVRCVQGAGLGLQRSSSWSYVCARVRPERPGARTWHLRQNPELPPWIQQSRVETPESKSSGMRKTKIQDSAVLIENSHQNPGVPSCTTRIQEYPVCRPESRIHPSRIQEYPSTQRELAQ